MSFVDKDGYLIPDEFPLKDGDYCISKDQLKEIFYCLKMVTSYTYLQRISEILGTFIIGLNTYVSSQKEGSERFLMVLENCMECQVDLEDGLSILLTGQISTAIRKILLGLSFNELFSGRLLNDINYSLLGYGWASPSKGLFTWAEKATELSILSELAMKCEFSIPYITDKIQYLFSNKYLNLPPSPTLTTIKPDKEIPVCGIWQPISFVSGCLNYLVAGVQPPKIEIPVKRSDYPEYVDEFNVTHPAKSVFEYESFSSSWLLIWEDRRYGLGLIPRDEADYLNENTELPAESPETP